MCYRKIKYYVNIIIKELTYNPFFQSLLRVHIQNKESYGITISFSFVRTVFQYVNPFSFFFISLEIFEIFLVSHNYNKFIIRPKTAPYEYFAICMII